jgi:hypothetical protein
VKRINLRTLGCLLTVLAAPAAPAYTDGDWQFWTTDGVDVQLNKTVKARLETELYFGDDMSDFYYWHLDAGIAAALTPWFEAGINYRYLQEKKKGEWMEENRPHVNGTLLWKLGPLSFSARNRLEYRMREGADDSWRYRNRLRLSPKAKWGPWQIQPYVDDEVFYDFDAGEWNQNRASAGLTGKLTKGLKADIYYMLQSTKKTDDWLETNILGVNLRLTF